MSNKTLEQDEQEILHDFESGAFVSILTPERKQHLVQIAAQTSRCDTHIDVLISALDLEAIQKRALVKGIPYQTLMSRIIHNYASENGQPI